MPTIDVNLHDLNKLAKKDFTIDQLESKDLLIVKGELDGQDGDELKVDVKETNRPDLWSVEGIARELRSQYDIEQGLDKYQSTTSNLKVTIDKSLENIRPFIVCAVLKNITITDESLRQLIQLQEKVALTFGRKRSRAAIGVYDLNKINGNIKYYAADPKEKFTPLEFSEPITLDQIISKHPKGQEFGHLLEKFDKYPLLKDEEDNVLSMPPLINSNHSGRVTEDSTDLFVEVTGTDLEVVDVALKAMAMALVDRGATLEQVEVQLIDGSIIKTPSFSYKEMEIDINYIRKIIGLPISAEEMILLLKKRNLDAEQIGDKLLVKYPDFRKDIMHPVDIIEDMLISFGYNDIEPEELKIITEPGESKLFETIRPIRDILAGNSLQEVSTFNLCSREMHEKKMQLEDEFFVEIANPVTINFCLFRKSIMPSLLEVLSKNTNVSYPQNIFEVGTIVDIDSDSETHTKTKHHVAVALANNQASFSQIKSVLQSICQNMEWSYSIENTTHPSFIPGRVAKIVVNGKSGLIGEIHPQVLENFNLSVPVSILEFSLE